MDISKGEIAAYITKADKRWREFEGEPLRALAAHEEVANAAARRGDKNAYLSALREWCRAGRDEALRIRKGAA